MTHDLKPEKVDTWFPKFETIVEKNILTKLYPPDIKYNIQHGLRHWTKQYPDGARVLRRSSRKQPIGFTSIVPVHPESARDFCLPPKRSRSLARFVSASEDPIQIANPGDVNCYIAYIRSWQLNPKSWTHDNALKLLEETQSILRRMQQDYPNLSDIYSINIHPRFA